MKKILAVVAVAALAGCKSNGGGDTKQGAETAKPAETAQVATPTGPMSSLTATVAFTGTVPTPRKLKMTPECGGAAVTDEEVLVADGKLANVMVRVIEGVPASEGKGQGVEIVQEKCVYMPRVTGVHAGQSIAVTSKDAFLHNVHTFSGDVSIFNKGQPSPSTFVKEASEFTAGGKQIKDGPIAFKCDVHPWMISYVVVNPNPYFAVSGKDGVAKLELPVGKYKVEAWHERYGTKTADVTVEEGKTAEIKFEYSGSETKS